MAKNNRGASPKPPLNNLEGNFSDKSGLNLTLKFDN